MNSKFLTVFIIIAGLLLSALIASSGGLALMALPFLFYLGAGILRAPDPDKIHLTAVRIINQNDAEGTEGKKSVDVRVTVRNEGAPIDRLVLTDVLPNGLKIEGDHRAVLSLGFGEEAVIAYSFQASRGSFHWPAVKAQVSDPFSLVVVGKVLPAEGEFHVQPVIKKFRAIPLRPRHTLHAAGPIPARLAGSGTDFWGVREYHPGDSLRWIDWHMAARHPRKLFTKEFEEEEIADIGLILDARELTDLQFGNESLFEHSVEAAAALAEVFLRSGNRVSLLIYGETMVQLFPGYGKVQLNRIMRALAKSAPGSINSLNSLDYLPVRLFPQHAYVVIISPLAQNDWQLFPRLRAFGYEVMLISPDPVDFATRLLVHDTASNLAVRAARIERRLQLKRIAQLHIPVVDWQVEQSLSGIVHETLSRARAQRERIA